MKFRGISSDRKICFIFAPHSFLSLWCSFNPVTPKLPGKVFFFSKINHLNEIFFKILRYIYKYLAKKRPKKRNPNAKMQLAQFFWQDCQLKKRNKLVDITKKMTKQVGVEIALLGTTQWCQMWFEKKQLTYEFRLIFSLPTNR